MPGLRISALCMIIVILTSCFSGQNNCIATGPLDVQSVRSTRGTTTAELAAIAMVRAHANKDYALFMRTRALFECEDEDRGGPNRYAESLHLTKFVNREFVLTIYDLPLRLNSDTARASAKQTPTLEFIDAAMFADTVPHQRLIFVDIIIEDHNEVAYQTRVVVVENSKTWYAVPRCYASRRIYELADAAELSTPTTSK